MSVAGEVAWGGIWGFGGMRWVGGGQGGEREGQWRGKRRVKMEMGSVACLGGCIPTSEYAMLGWRKVRVETLKPRESRSSEEEPLAWFW